MKLSTRVSEVLASCHTREQTKVAVSYAKLARKKVHNRHSALNPPEFSFHIAMEEQKIDCLVLQGMLEAKTKEKSISYKKFSEMREEWVGGKDCPAIGRPCQFFSWQDDRMEK